MTHGDAFLQAVLAEPEDDAPRLIYADWLEERGDPRGAFIRLQCAWNGSAQRTRRVPIWKTKPTRCCISTKRNGRRRCNGIASEWRFRRGFVEEATVSGDEFLGRGDDLFDAYPIIRLRVRLKRGQVGGVAASPHLARLRKLDVSSCQSPRPRC